MCEQVGDYEFRVIVTRMSGRHSLYWSLSRDCGENLSELLADGRSSYSLASSDIVGSLRSELDSLIKKLLVDRMTIRCSGDAQV
jgi:hypothetical protein